MKKLFKIFGLAFVLGTLFCMTSCDDLFNTEEDPLTKAKSYEKQTDAINHEFWLSDDKSSYLYYTSTQSFNYGKHEDCIYQISFTPKDSAASKGNWKLYTRPRGSSKTIELVHEGTFRSVNSGSVRNGGTIELLIGSEVIDTLTIEYKTVTTATGNQKEAYAFTANVAASHKAIGAKDSK